MIRLFLENIRARYIAWRARRIYDELSAERCTLLLGKLADAQRAENILTRRT